MTFLNTRKQFILSLLGSFICLIFYPCNNFASDKNASTRETDTLQINTSFKNICKDKIAALNSLDIETIYLVLPIQGKRYNIKTSLFKKFNYVITNQLEPFCHKQERQRLLVESMAFAHLVFASKKEKITIDICDYMFFWGGKRQLKYAFVSEALTKLIIEGIETYKDKEKDWIVKILQGDTRPVGRPVQK